MLRALHNGCRSAAWLIVAAALAASSSSAAEPVGFAVSTEPFLVEGSEVLGNVTVLAGEVVSSNHLPLRVRLSTGHELTLGPGSQARFWSDRARVDGVSVDFQAATGASLAVEFGPLVFEAAAGAGAVIYGDRPATASAWAKADSVRVSSVSSGQSATLEPGGSATFSIVGDELRLQDQRAPLEIARIQIRQLRYLAQMAVTRPGVEGRSQVLLRRLSAASGGLLQVDPTEDQPGRNAIPAVDSERLLAAAIEVHGRLLAEPWADAGCGSPDCIHRKRSREPHNFVGWAGGLQPRPGCELCRAGNLGIPE